MRLILKSRRVGSGQQTSTESLLCNTWLVSSVWRHLIPKTWKSIKRDDNVCITMRTPDASFRDSEEPLKIKRAKLGDDDDYINFSREFLCANRKGDPDGLVWLKMLAVEEKSTDGQWRDNVRMIGNSIKTYLDETKGTLKITVSSPKPVYFPFFFKATRKRDYWFDAKEEQFVISLPFNIQKLEDGDDSFENRHTRGDIDPETGYEQESGEDGESVSGNAKTTETTPAQKQVGDCHGVADMNVVDLTAGAASGVIGFSATFECDGAPSRATTLVASHFIPAITSKVYIKELRTPADGKSLTVSGIIRTEKFANNVQGAAFYRYDILLNDAKFDGVFIVPFKFLLPNARAGVQTCPNGYCNRGQAPMQQATYNYMPPTGHSPIGTDEDPNEAYMGAMR
uniref:Uncharacterized protein n=1 Tax=Chromera velia CCMP2878 TaxID=1169474 RepID=A0A0G4FQR1_9ALVE|eukprot:Cvel_18128.t1-p1 / transcript=Cvel_18128.t1 / gene=Cvel_18128 / organism=Chromera_velia_CCMP2878 / gene_product=hypothetical protein / transcript_product=hypothetical protein / location=Cvel_scaffold1487:22566-30666(+) / protein_length=396 / sequence_SO=supercontig / SO=protein_coding / is_pseudo=false